MRHRIGDGLQIVQQADPLQARGAGQRGFLEVPWQVGQVRAPADHRAGHVETGGGGVAAGLGQERLDDRLQALVVGAVEFLLGDELARAGLAARPAPAASWCRRYRPRSASLARLPPDRLDLLQRLSLRLRHAEVDPDPADAAEQREQPERQRIADRIDQRQEELADQEGRTPVDRRGDGDAPGRGCGRGRPR